MPAQNWTLIAAWLDGELAGYAYGFTLAAQSQWWQGIDMPKSFTNETGARTFAVSEIMTRAPWRRQGIARSLHGRLLMNRPEERATLLADPDNGPAQNAYASWGYRKVAQLRPAWDGAPLFDVLILPLPHPSPADTFADAQS
jgi:GNAT superfamily N-acetyltransferase